MATAARARPTVVAATALSPATKITTDTRKEGKHQEAVMAVTPAVVVMVAVVTVMMAMTIALLQAMIARGMARTVRAMAAERTPRASAGCRRR